MLLDTNVLIRMTSDPEKLGPVAWDLIEGGPVLGSSVSHVEIIVKRMLGKLEAPDDLRRLFAGEGVDPLPFTDEHAHHVNDFPQLSRHDPFDRMLLAQAASESVEFMTADQTLLGLDLDWVIDARK